jgi:hypothetical protein
LKSRTTRGFRAAFRRLPADVQDQCRDAYRLFLLNSRHPSLRFKKVHSIRPIYSARVSRGYRAVCVLEGEEALWFFVGTHADYDILIKRL